MNERAIDAIAEIFTWVGFGGAVVLALATLVVWLADGSWSLTQVVLADEQGQRSARWFGSSGRVGHAWLTPDQQVALDGRDTAEVYVRVGSDDRVRLTKGSPTVRFLGWLTVGFFALGVVATAASIVFLMSR